MEVYFTLDNYRRRFSVIINNLNISIFRIENRELIWEGNVLNIFIGKSHLNDMTEYSGARDNPKWDGNSILLELETNEDEINEKEVSINLQDKRQKQKPKYKLGDIVRTADKRNIFSKGDSTNWSYKLYTITEVIHDTIPSYRINYFPERYNEQLLKNQN